MLADVLIVRMVDLLSGSRPWSYGGPRSSANDFGFNVQFMLWREVVSGMVLLLLVAALALPWRRHWLPAVLLAACGWTGPLLGPAGLLLMGVSDAAQQLGLSVQGDLRWWGASSLAVSLVLLLVVSVLRWRHGPPRTGEPGSGRRLERALAR